MRRPAEARMRTSVPVRTCADRPTGTCAGRDRGLHDRRSA